MSAKLNTKREENIKRRLIEHIVSRVKLCESDARHIVDNEIDKYNGDVEEAFISIKSYW